MKIVETLHKDSLSSGAIIEVVENEIADIDRMLVMIDGVMGEDYSAVARLVSLDEPPKLRTFAGERTALRQRHLQRPGDIRQKKRYYEVLLTRDLTY